MGIAPQWIQNVTGIVKCYCTRVGEGPFPTEAFGDIGETLRSEKEILLQFDAEYFDPNCDAIKKALEIMTNKIPPRPAPKRTNPFATANKNNNVVAAATTTTFTDNITT